MCGGLLDIETDGDTWHANPASAAQDNLRDNNLAIAGWKLLRFNSRQIREERKDYCLPTIVKTINSLGGVDEGKSIPRKVDANVIDGTYQPSLFDTQ